MFPPECDAAPAESQPDMSILRGPYAAIKDGDFYIAILVAPGHEKEVFGEEDDLIAIARTFPASRRTGGPIALVPGKIYASFKLCTHSNRPIISAASALSKTAL